MEHRIYETQLVRQHSDDDVILSVNGFVLLGNVCTI